VVKYTKYNIALLMHERQAAVVVVSILIFSVIFVTESFAQIPQCNGLDATIVGTDDKDIIRGSSEDDVIVSLGGNDIVYGMSGNDVICGGDRNDRLYGNSGNDILIGQEGFDSVNGGKGIDTCDSTDEHSSSHHSDDEDNDCEIQYKETPVNNDDLQKQIDELKSQINDIIFGFIKWSQIQGVPEELLDGDNDAFAKIKCTTDQMIKWSGTQWECFDEKIELLSIPIFFQHSSTSGGVPEWVGTTNQIFEERDSDKASFVMPFSGTLSNLIAKIGTSGEATNPGPNESIILTVIKNGIDTSLSCTISDVQTECSDTSNKISIIQGDLIILRVNPSSNAPLANIRISAQLSQ
jgi:hypothetical protein